LYSGASRSEAILQRETLFGKTSHTNNAGNEVSEEKRSRIFYKCEA